MSTHFVRLIDPSGTVVAKAQVADEGDHYGGTIDLGDTPASLKAVFDEFEEIVNGQMFSFLDEIEGKLGALRLTAVFDDGRALLVRGLQVFPTTGDVSFQLTGAPARQV